MNRIITGDTLDVLKTLDSGIVQCVITSPPYWSLRDYQEDGQYGLEETPELYIENMVNVFREVKRVLRDDGTLWLNMGYKFDGHGNCIDIPHMLKDALVVNGWFFKCPIIWHKPNPMPGSQTQRPTLGHEPIFLLAKDKATKYFYDADAVREKGNEKPHSPGWANSMSDRNDRQVDNESNKRDWGEQGTRNLRDVWTIATQACSFAHFATFPKELVNKCILAGTPEKACAKCGQGWERIVEKPKPPFKDTRTQGKHTQVGNGKIRGGDLQKWLNEHPTKTLGFRPACDCKAGISKAIVLDPFGGTGTVAVRAKRMGREIIHIDLSEKYNAYAEERLAQEELF